LAVSGLAGNALINTSRLQNSKRLIRRSRQCDRSTIG
jgi:hypothetical protein